MGAVVCSSNKSSKSINNNNTNGETSSILGGSVIRQRLDSVISNCSSVMGFTAVMGVADLTDYEKRLIPKIWSDCLKQNPYYCDHSFDRFVDKHPEVVGILHRAKNGENNGTSSSPNCQKRVPFRKDSVNHLTPDRTTHCIKPSDVMDPDEDLVQSEANRLRAFFDRLIIDFDMDEEKIQTECEALGRRHAAFFQHGLASIHWPTVAQCLVYEYKKTVTAMDESVEENELHTLAWTHFVSAIVATVKDAFDQELSPNHSPYDDTFSGTEFFKS